MQRQATGRRGQTEALTAEQYESLPLIYFDQSRNESKQLAQHFKLLQHNLRTSYRFASSKDFLSLDRVKNASVTVLAGPREVIDEQDGLVLAKFMEQGGGVIILGSEGSDPSTSTSNLINAFTDPLGITIKDNSVVRTVYHKECFHPKEVHISKPAISESFNNYVLKFRPPPSSLATSSSSASSLVSPSTSALVDGPPPLSIVFPYGCSVIASEPAVPLLTSGPFSLPPQSPVAALCRYGAGFLTVLGSCEVFDDEYIEKADNLALARALFGLTTDKRLEIGLGDGEIVRTSNHGNRTVLPITTATTSVLRPTTTGGPTGSSSLSLTGTGRSLRAALDGDASSSLTGINFSVDPSSDEAKGEWAPVPDTEALASRLRPCLQESDELPTDMNGLIDPYFYRLDNSLIPEALKLYQRLGVEHAPLSLVRPVLELSYPRVQPAVFMPLLMEAPPPDLDLFDLDEQFADDKLRLAQLTNKCTEKDIDYFVEEAAHILGIADAMRVQDKAGAPQSGSNGESSATGSKTGNSSEVKSGSTNSAGISSSTSAVLSGPRKKLTAKEILAFVTSRIVQLKRIDTGTVDTMPTMTSSLPAPTTLPTPSSSSASSTS